MLPLLLAVSFLLHNHILLAALLHIRVIVNGVLFVMLYVIVPPDTLRLFALLLCTGMVFVTQQSCDPHSDVLVATHHGSFRDVPVGFMVVQKTSWLFM